MPIKPRNPNNVRSVELGAAHEDHTHTHSEITGVGTDDHHAEAHTVASHSDTTATGAELETLTDGSDADALHTHPSLVPLTQEEVEDFVGAMLAGNTETLITVTYQDADGTIDFVVDNDLANYDNSVSAFITDVTGSPLSELQDVTITTIASGEILKWNGSAWINQTLAEAGISATGHSHVETDITDLDHNDPEAIHDNVSGEIAAVTAKTTPVDADVTLIEDSAATNAKKSLSWANIKATLKTYFDTLYAALVHTHTESEITDLTHTTDHGALGGLADDDHTQYLNVTRHDADDHSGLLPIDHGADITGLTDDDHTQYLLADGTRNLSAGLTFDEIAEPSAPAADDLVLWAEDNQGLTILAWKDSTGESHSVGQDSYLIVRNNTGAQIDKGKAVYINGSTGSVPTIALADASSASTLPAVGLADEDIADVSFGRIVTFGKESGFDTSAFLDGDILYVSETAGGLTATPPTLAQRVGVVITASLGNGVVFVSPGAVQNDSLVDHGLLTGLGDDDHTQYLNVTRHDADDHDALPEAAVTQHEAALTITESQISDLTHKTNVDSLDDATITTPADNEVLAYDTTSSEWINQTPAEAGLAEDAHTHTESDVTDLAHYTTTDFTTDHTAVSGDHVTGGDAHTHTESDVTDLDHDDADAIHDNVAGEINAITEKLTPVNADLVIIEDSADSNNKKKAQLGNLPGGGGGSSDHGALTGLGDDDHTQYVLASGARAITGEQQFKADQALVDAQVRITDDGDPNSVLLRNDGNAFHILLTDTEGGAWNSLRPFHISLTSGQVTMEEGLAMANSDITAANVVEADWLQSDEGRLSFTAYGTYDTTYNNYGQIISDNGSYKTLMILGNKAAGGNRRVELWDELYMQGFIDMQGNNIDMGGANIYYSGTTDPSLRFSSAYLGIYNGGWAQVNYSDRSEIRQNADVTKLRFYGDTDTGLTRTTVNTVGLEAGGIVHIQLNDDGRLYCDPNNGSGNQTFYLSQERAWICQQVATGSSSRMEWTTTTNKWVRWSDNSYAHDNAGVSSGSSGSHFYINEDLTNVGNHETLRLDRGASGSGSLQDIGYYSSLLRHPETGRLLKRNVVDTDTAAAMPLEATGAASFDLDWIDKIKPIFFQRTDTKEAALAVDGLSGIEFGFATEHLAETSPYLTTKPGEKVGGSPDEMALIATLWASNRDLRKRIQALEEAMT